MYLLMNQRWLIFIRFFLYRTFANRFVVTIYLLPMLLMFFATLRLINRYLDILSVVNFLTSSSPPFREKGEQYGTLTTATDT
jgi:hypothetical protein